MLSRQLLELLPSHALHELVHPLLFGVPDRHQQLLAELLVLALVPVVSPHDPC